MATVNCNCDTIHPLLDNGSPFQVYSVNGLPNATYRVRPGSYREGSVLLQRWDEPTQDWVSEGRRQQGEVLAMKLDWSVDDPLHPKPSVTETVIETMNIYQSTSNACAACSGTGKLYPDCKVSDLCHACKGTGRRTLVSTVGRDVKKEKPSSLTTRSVGRPTARITAEPDLDKAPDMGTEQFMMVLDLLNRKTLTLKQVTNELGITRRQAYHCIYWLRAFNYLSEEQDEGVRGRQYTTTNKGSKFLKEIKK